MSVRRLTAGLALGVGLSALALTAVADIEPPTEAVPVVGMAHDPNSDSLWLAGPDADQGIFINSEDGRELTFGGEPESVQALAWGIDDRLWIGDIGDPEASREFVVVYRLASTAESRPTYNAFDFQYEDGPRHAEAMMISGRGRIYVITSGDDPGVYRASLEPSRQEMNTLTRVLDAPEGVTDGTFLSDGTTLALRTANGIEYIDALTWEPMVTDTLVGAPEGESIAAGDDDDIYVGGNPVIREVAMPEEDTTTVLGDATPSPSPSSSPSPSPSVSASETTAPSATASTPAAVESTVITEVVEDETSAPGRVGTVVALVLAGVVAVGAAAATFILKK